MSGSQVGIRANRLTKRWGGLVAVDAMSIEVLVGEIHAVIGTNGAGKSTLVNLLSGELRADQGSVELLGRDVTGWGQAKRAQAGIGRSYQRSNVFPDLTVLENCRLAAQAKRQLPFDWLTPASHCKVSNQVAREAAHRSGLGDFLQRRATELSHGQRRQLEIAMCLAIEPRVLLLDEPLAGMGAEETDRMLELLLALRRTHAILLVEHDMDAVFRVSDRITVMVNGQVLASGQPSDIRCDASVQRAYLGEMS